MTQRHRWSEAVVLVTALIAATCQSSSAPTTAATADRLTREQYRDTVKDVFGVDLPPEVVPGEAVDRTGILKSTPVTASDLRSYLDAADLVHAGAAQQGTLATYTTACATPPRACAEAMIRTIGKRLYRRALTEGEVSALLQLYDTTGADHASKTGFLLDALLVSPNFLYVGDFAPHAAAPGSELIEPHALAARLSYFLWQSAPDDELLDAAEQGRLSTRDDVVREAKRLFNEVGKSERAVRAFARRWLDLDATKLLVKSATMYPGFNAQVAPVVGEESERFVAHVVLRDDARYETLLTAPYTFVSTATAPLYDLPTTGVDGAAFVKASLDPQIRGGLLTQLPLLALTGHAVSYPPTLRGKLVRQRFLCQDLPAPPANVDVTPPPPDLTRTVRDQYREHSDVPLCASCHGRMDPIGVGFARYDSAGRYRPYYFENNPDPSGKPPESTWQLDDSGDVYESVDANGPFHGPLELSRRLAKSRAAQDCFVTQVYRFALSRRETDADAPELLALQAAFQTANHNIRDLFVLIAASDAFRYRPVYRPAAGAQP